MCPRQRCMAASLPQHLKKTSTPSPCRRALFCIFVHVLFWQQAWRRLELLIRPLGLPPDRKHVPHLGKKQHFVDAAAARACWTACPHSANVVALCCRPVLTSCLGCCSGAAVDRLPVRSTGLDQARQAVQESWHQHRPLHRTGAHFKVWLPNGEALLLAGERCCSRVCTSTTQCR